jgi:NHLM bacteriocin system ABC transporter peptidase/ATP-binding protein
VEKSPRKRRVKTPTVLQMEAVECGAAALSIILGYYGRHVPLEELRIACGVSRDGTKASNMLKVARQYGLKAKGFKKEPDGLRSLPLPLIVFWNFNHFLVVEGFKRGRVFLNDPASGPRTVSIAEFDEAFTGIALVFEPGPDFEKGGRKRNLLQGLHGRLTGSELALVFVVLASLALVVPGIVIPIFTKVFVDEVLVKGLSDWLSPLLIGMGLAAILRAALTWLRSRYLLRLETKLALSMSGQFFWHVLQLPMEFFTQRYGGEIGSRVAINDRVAEMLSGQLATTFLNVIVIVFFAVLMFFYDVPLTLVAIAVATLNVIALRFVARKRVDGSKRLLQESGKLIGTSMVGLQMIETLKATGSESDFFSRWSGQHAKVVNAQQSLAVYTQFLLAVPPLLTGLSGVAILSFGATRVMDGYLTMGMLIAFQSLMQSFIRPIEQLMQIGGTLQEMQGDMNRLDDVLRYDADRTCAVTDPVDDELAAGKLVGKLELLDVTFGYSRMAEPLLENFTLSLNPGSRVALVGATGSGKSTVARITSNICSPWSGEVRFDGCHRRDIPRSRLTSSLAMVDQEVFLFEGTVRENLTLWDPTIPEADIIRAAKDARIHEDIAARPGGYDSHVEEGGRNFSGGQRQRLEIARALVGNPTMLIMDEATSALDPVTEQIVDTNLRRRGCTCLIVAHRLSTIRDCDEIIVLDHGHVVQRGTHDELIGQDGPYVDLVGAEA